MPAARTMSDEQIGQVIKDGWDPYASTIVEGDFDEAVFPIDASLRREVVCAWQIGKAFGAALAADAETVDASRVFREGVVLDLKTTPEYAADPEGCYAEHEIKQSIQRLFQLIHRKGDGPLRPARVVRLPRYRAHRRNAHNKIWGESIEIDNVRAKLASPANVPVIQDVMFSIVSGAPILLLRDPGVAIPTDIAALLGLSARVQPFSQSDIIDLLSLTHSATGEVAVDALHQLLPSDEVLGSLATWPILAAFAGATTIDVAHRLSGLCAPAGENNQIDDDPRQTADERNSIPDATVDPDEDEDEDEDSDDLSDSTPKRLKLRDVKGQESVVAELSAIAEDVSLWTLGEVAWSDIVSSIVLHGPPGSGKTMAAEALAGELDIPLIDSSIGSCQSKGPLSDTLKAFNETVAQAKRQAPAVLMMDELDSLMPRSSGENGSYMRLLVNAILEALPKILNMEGVILIGATNDLEMIDPAIIRSGRFDLKLWMSPPNLEGLRAIVRASLRDSMTDTDFACPDMEEVIRMLVGSSGADAAMVARHAKGIARRRNSTSPTDRRVTAADVRTAALTIVSAADDDDLWKVAIHEAGHVVIGVLRGLGWPRSVQLRQRGGQVEWPTGPLRTSTTVWSRIISQLGGRAAEWLAFREVSVGSGGGPTSDLALATRAIVAAEFQFGIGVNGPAWDPATIHDQVLSQEDRSFVNSRLLEAQAEALDLLSDHRDHLKKFARILFEKREVDAATISEVLGDLAKNMLPLSQLTPYVCGESPGDDHDTNDTQDPPDRRLTFASCARQAHTSIKRTLP